jgi:hypothetical protein
LSPVDEWDVEGEDIEFMPDVAGEYTLQVQISGGDVSTVRQFVIRAYDATSGGGEIGIQ